MAGTIDDVFNETFSRTLVEGDEPLVENVTWSRLGYNETDVTDWDLKLVSITGDAKKDEDFAYSHDLLESGLKITLEATEDEEFNIEEDEIVNFNLEGFVCYDWPFNESPENQTPLRDQGTVTIELTVEEKGFTDETETADLNKSDGTIDTIKKHYGSKGGDDIVTLHDGISNHEFDAGAGNDTITGGAGNDRIKGGAGNDKITGDENDVAVFSGIGSQYNVIIDPSRVTYKVEGPDGVDQVRGKVKAEFGGVEFSFDEIAAAAFDNSNIQTFRDDIARKVSRSEALQELKAETISSLLVVEEALGSTSNELSWEAFSGLVGLLPFDKIGALITGEFPTKKVVQAIGQEGFERLAKKYGSEAAEGVTDYASSIQRNLQHSAAGNPDSFDVDFKVSVTDLAIGAGTWIFSETIFKPISLVHDIYKSASSIAPLISDLELLKIELANLKNHLENIDADILKTDNLVDSYLESMFEQTQQKKGMPNISLAPKSQNEASNEFDSVVEQKKAEAQNLSVTIEPSSDENNGDDTKEGTDERDEEFTGSGNDNVDTKAGDDFADTGDGDDTLELGSGDDFGQAGDGNDIVNGGTGKDIIFGGGGHDTITDTIGDSEIHGGDGNDRAIVIGGRGQISGGEGSDFLTGGFKNDNISGEGGNDLIQGDPGKGFLSIGSDVIDGGTGNDFLMGGRGADVFVFETFDGADTIAGFDSSDVIFDAANGYSVTPLRQDFQSGVDHVQLAGFSTVDASNVMSSVIDGTDGAVFSAEGTSITFYDVTADKLDADDFIFV